MPPQAVVTRDAGKALTVDARESPADDEIALVDHRARDDIVEAAEGAPTISVPEREVPHAHRAGFADAAAGDPTVPPRDEGHERRVEAEARPERAPTELSVERHDARRDDGAEGARIGSRQRELAADDELRVVRVQRVHDGARGAAEHARDAA